MKNYMIYSFALGLGVLTACSSTPNDRSTQPPVGLANPASQFCIEQGGKLDIRHEATGQVGYCHLPDGQVVEEWAFFRENHQKCLAEQAKELIGQSGLSDEKILKSTHSTIIRRVAPGQPVTMDYRENRITITIDPKSQTITHATCG